VVVRRAIPIGTQPPLSLPIFDRLAAPPPRKSLIARIERHTGANDVVVDLHGRGGWIARAAIERRRRAVSIESTPLTRLLAELVLRPPDIRHLDAAFQSIASAARGKSNLRLALAEPFATQCATCERIVSADVVVWRGTEPVAKHYRCPACRNQQSAAEVRQGSLDDADRERALSAGGAAKARAILAKRFPIPDAHAALVDGVLGLHSNRQLVGLAAILEQVEAPGRGNHVDAALRLAFAHAVHPASRLATHPARTAPLRIAAGRIRLPSATEWYEQNAWSAFDDAFRLIRSFIQRLDADSARGDGDTTAGALHARYSDEIGALGDGPASAVVRLATKSTWRKLERESRELAARESHPRVPLVLTQAPASRLGEALALEYHITAWALGAGAASTLPIEPLLGSHATTADGEAVALAASLTAIEPLVERDGRAIVLLGGGQPSLVAAALGGVDAGFRVASAHLGEPGDADGYVELVPPGASPPPGPRTRANVALPAIPGGPGDPELVPGPGLFTPPERHDARRFSAVDVGRTVTETAVAVLRARGEPASSGVLFGEILVALDRGGHLRRLIAERGADGTAPKSVDRLLGIVRTELGESKYRRLREIAPDEWWLSDRDDRDAAAASLADRVEWAVYSLLSTSGTLSESAFIDRVTGLFAGHDRPEESLVRACLDSYRSDPDDVDHVTTTEDLLARTHEHGLLLADLAEGGHRLDMRVWISAREQARRIGERRLGDVLDDAERRVHLPLVAPGPLVALEAVDCIWYVPGRVAFLFEVEWTAMIGETILRRHARIPPDDRVVRFMLVPSQRAALVRYKIDRSPLLREAVVDGNWHVLKWDHLRAFLAQDPLSLDAMEPFLGLEPAIERGEARQLPLFAG
jgi:hypothetical protein